MTKVDYSKVTNAWIDPKGVLHPCKYFGHNEWANEYLEKKFKLDFLDLQKILKKEKCDYAHEYLCKKGWLRLLWWSDTMVRVVGYSDTDQPNKDQEEELYLWCAVNKKDYETLFLK